MAMENRVARVELGMSMSVTLEIKGLIRYSDDDNDDDDQDQVSDQVQWPGGVWAAGAAWLLQGHLHRHDEDLDQAQGSLGGGHGGRESW